MHRMILLLSYLIGGYPLVLDAQYGVYNGPSFVWKTDNHALQAIVDELRKNELEALKKVRTAFDIPIATWDQYLNKFVKEHQEDMFVQAALSFFPFFTKSHDKMIPHHIIETFSQTLTDLGIRSDKIYFVHDNFDKVKKDPTYDYIAGTSNWGFIINSDNPAWQDHDTTTFVKYHEIGHFIEGHIKRSSLVEACINENSIYPYDENNAAIIDLRKSEEEIADIILAVYNPKIANEIHTFCAQQIEQQTMLRPSCYMPWESVLCYTEKIIFAHKQNKHRFLSKASVMRKRLHILSLFIRAVGSEVVRQATNNIYEYVTQSYLGK